MDTSPLKIFRQSQTPPLSQRGLAQLLGVARETVARWELGKRKIDDEKLSLVSDKTGIPKRTLRPDLVLLLEQQEPAEAAQ